MVDLAPGIKSRARLEDSSEILRQRLDRFFRTTDRQGPVVALEVGGGDGRCSAIVWESLSRCYPDPGTRLYTLDIEAALVLAAQRRLGCGAGNGVRVLRGDLYRLPLAAQQLDFVLALNVVFWADRRRLLEEARRVLKTGGKVFAYDLLPVPEEGTRPLVSFSLTREQIR